jgi:hypothetical protein
MSMTLTSAVHGFADRVPDCAGRAPLPSRTGRTQRIAATALIPLERAELSVEEVIERIKALPRGEVDKLLAPFGGKRVRDLDPEQLRKLDASLGRGGAVDIDPFA